MRGTFGLAIEFEERGVCPTVHDDLGAEGRTVQHLRRDNAQPTRGVDHWSLEGGVELPTRRGRHG